MSTHPLWRPYGTMAPEEVAKARVGVRARRVIAVVPSDPDWPRQYAVIRDALVRALGNRVLEVAHVGSTSVPGLSAKPIIDVDLTVADPAREEDWLPDLEAAGFRLVVREPEWDEHRVVTYAEPDANVHVWPPRAQEPARHLAFARWLTTHDDDRAAYGDLKARLAGHGFGDSSDYNNAKSGLVYDIYERIFAADENHPHDPQPRH